MYLTQINPQSVSQKTPGKKKKQNYKVHVLQQKGRNEVLM